MARKNLKTRPDLGDQEWLALVAASPENRGIDVRGLYRRMLEWCAKKGVPPTRKRLLVWLDNERDAMPMTYEPAYLNKAGDPDCAECGNTRRVRVNDFSSPCPRCRPAEEKAFWKARGK